MSVPQGERSHAKLEVMVKAQDLLIYTLQITKNKKVFTEEFQAPVTDEIIKTAQSIFYDAWEANNIRVAGNPDAWRERRTLQQRAARKCNRLLAQMQVAQRVLHFKTKRLKYWGGKTIEVRNLLRAWCDADQKRYGDLLKQGRPL